ncbi:TPA: hypothetical protein N0F65_002100 [Lagenidium giganteum]|uniref:Tetratricopeptide repeat protein n=1 Tax=Lagenidium giganteum TaxID=4803 RepID=A0AAV2ZHS0_9STRA|nr:TPA: hypothetical protein N0F65_002100 [Lagenidium giganteum]
MQHSQSDVGVGRSAAIGSDTHRHNHDDLDTETELPACNRIISWGEDDISSFFLTEIDGKAAADQWQLASLIARGSYFLYAAAEFKHAVLCFSDALALTQVDLGTPNDPVALQALLNHHIGEAFKEEGLAKWALMMQKKALQLAQQAQDTKIAGRAHKAIGVLCLDMHQFDKARKYQQRALDAAIQTKDIDLEARVYANLGNIASAQGEFGHAIASHERDLKLSSSKALRSALGMARAHRNLALVYEKLGRRELHAHHDAQASVTDLQQHSRSAVGNVYLQLTYPNTKLADMVATSVQDLLRELATRGHVMLPQSSMPTASAQNPMQFDQVAQSNAY